MTGTGGGHPAPDLEWVRLTRFLGRLKERGRRRATLDAYDKDWRSLARWYATKTGRRFDLTRFTALDAVDYLAFLGRTCKPATVARRVLFFRTYAAEAYRAQELAEDVFRRIQLLWSPKPAPSAPQGLTADDARAALRNVERDGGPRDRAIVFVFLLTGIRVGELAGLEVRDLELQERSGTLRLRAEVAKGSRERTVPLATEVRAPLQAYLATRHDTSPGLFVGQRGRMTPSGIRDVVARYTGVPPQRLRHTFAYEYLRSNHNDVVALADVLGHASLNTARGYVRRARARRAGALPAAVPDSSSSGRLREALARLLERNGRRRPPPPLVGQEVLVDPRNPAVCQINGAVFAARQRFVREAFGEQGFQEVLARVSPATRAYAERPLASGWCDFASLVEYDRVVYQQFHSRYPHVLTLLGAASAEYGGGTLYRLLDQEGLVGFLEGLVHFHGLYQKYGRAVFTRSARGGLMACYGNPCYSPLYCASAIGFYLAELVRHGARNPRVEELKCHCRGDDACVYQLEWS